MWENTPVLIVRIGKPATQPGKLTVLIMKVSKGSNSMIQWKSVTQSCNKVREVTPLCNVKSVVTQPGKLTVLLLIGWVSDFCLMPTLQFFS